MIRKLMEMQSKTPLAVLIANSNQDLTGIPLVESKENEIRLDEFDEESLFHQEPPPRSLIRGKSRFLDEGKQGVNFMVKVVGWPTTMGGELGGASEKDLVESC
ncbi:hypothetical protein IEQ34_016505 [Dendrobium chrysotoxum]|uniref:Uncharacterized protein n=1 Tax=Dendrobium chrysotoxum TaxID=161865 RepID=A0AAV7GER3_DENCH|nr:hypothetical protein IEQ34_016505 [Dendrobium chrysotoxum]